MSKLFLVDGLNLIFRCFYGIPWLNTQTFPTNAIFGSVKLLLKILKLEQSATVVVCFDKGRDPVRQNLLPEYKANRVEIPDPVKIQIPVVKEFAAALGCTVVERSGIEADDLIASLAKKYIKNFNQIFILSTDKDFAQCIRGNVLQIIPGNNKSDLGNYFDRENIKEKFGVFPEQIVDFLSLIGDQADNIPGIRGVGPKTATSWLNNFQTIENIFQNINSLHPKRFQEIMLENQENLYRNRKLISLNENIDDIFLENNKLDADLYHKLIELYSLKSLKDDVKKQVLIQKDLFS